MRAVPELLVSPVQIFPARNLFGYVWKLSTQNVTPPKTGNIDGDETFLESHAVSILPSLGGGQVRSYLWGHDGTFWNNFGQHFAKRFFRFCIT